MFHLQYEPVRVFLEGSDYDRMIREIASLFCKSGYSY